MKLREKYKEFFIKNRTSKKSLSFIISYYSLNDENMKVIEKYKKLGIIKKFGVYNNF